MRLGFIRLPEMKATHYAPGLGEYLIVFLPIRIKINFTKNILYTIIEFY